MGYWADAIIDCEETSPERARELAASIIGWLVDARIIEDRQCDGCMRDGPCYLPGPAYQTACKEVPPGFGNSKYESFLEAGLNGMRVVTSPQFLFNSSGAFPDMRCPRCDAEVDLGVFCDEGAKWTEGGPDTFECPHCKAASPIPAWSHPSAGFATLAFEFFNWPEFSSDFLAELSRRLGGHRLNYFGGRQ
ncbi:hypothetical protein IP92_03265 [Pseudoduganella flava]|uniref:Sugar ABC transporter ATPase n=1 Tax=Pseudoduganella flava TaxID=871742 RepID=A0A562PN04_9BURK|nr:hypothetical protein [Pseudoduganella flava]QGZ40401.1 hypothetical protein GO485_15965 [Pseudoduganella flava]TWI45835.1 hypothetical protein IP92_03265 [Pseudoduganella flava]